MSVLLQLRLNLTLILRKFMPTLTFTGEYYGDFFFFFCSLFFIANLFGFVLIYSFQFFRRNQELIKELSTPQLGSEDLYFPTQYSQSFITQCNACFWKQHWSYWRNSQYNAIRFFMTIVIGILFGVIFWSKGDQM
jgi:hypothetical protein